MSSKRKHDERLSEKKCALFLILFVFWFFSVMHQHLSKVRQWYLLTSFPGSCGVVRLLRMMFQSGGRPNIRDLKKLSPDQVELWQWGKQVNQFYERTNVAPDL